MMPDLIDMILGDELEEEMSKEQKMSKETMQVKREHFYVENKTLGLGFSMVFVDLDSVNEVKHYIKLEYDYLKKYKINIYSKTNLTDERLPSNLFVEFSKLDEVYACFTVKEVENIDSIIKEIFRELDIVFVKKFK